MPVGRSKGRVIREAVLEEADEFIPLLRGQAFNAELFQGQQCDPQRHCTPLPGHRIYAGASWNVPIQPGLPIDYSVKVAAKISSQHF